MKKRLATILLAFCTVLLLCQCSREDENSTIIRIGCFPNVTHVQGLVARNMWRHKSCNGKGWFEHEIPGYTEEWYTFQAGPTAMEALFGKTVDLTYVGPGPVLNAYAVSAGREVRLLAGAVTGGSALMLAGNSAIRQASDFRGRSIATPQLGNTQDIACRAWLIRHGLSCPPEGNGDCRVAPTPNAMQLQLLTQGDVDACWTVEPWVSALETKAGARVWINETDAVTTVLAARVGWLKHHPQTARQVIIAHRKLTEWIQQNPEKAQAHIADELMHLTQSGENEREEFTRQIRLAWNRISLTNDLNIGALEQFVKDGQSTGLLDYVPPLQGLIYTPAPQESTAAH